MIFMLIFSALTFNAYQGSLTYKECMDINFNMPHACDSAKRMYDAGESLCKLQGKPFHGTSDCK